MSRPWLTLPPLLADHARAIRLLHLSTAELRSLHAPPPKELRCWRTTPEGRQWQAAINAASNPHYDPTTTHPQTPEESAK